MHYYPAPIFFTFVLSILSTFAYRSYGIDVLFPKKIILFESGIYAKDFKCMVINTVSLLKWLHIFFTRAVEVCVNIILKIKVMGNLFKEIPIIRF